MAAPAHTCHATGCDVVVPPAMFMCRKHWRMVPKRLQAAIWATYRPGQEVDKRPSPAYLANARAAIEAVTQAQTYDRVLRSLQGALRL